MEIQLARQPGIFTLYHVNETDRFPEYPHFIKVLAKSNYIESKRVATFMKNFCEKPDLFKNSKRFLKLKNSDFIWKMVPTDEVRFYCFQINETTWCITHGFYKKDDVNNVSRNSILNAEDCYRRYIDEHKQ